MIMSTYFSRFFFQIHLFLNVYNFVRCHNNRISTPIQSSLLKVEKFGRDKKATKKDTVTSNLRWVHEVTGYMQGTGGIAATDF